MRRLCITLTIVCMSVMLTGCTNPVTYFSNIVASFQEKQTNDATASILTNNEPKGESALKAQAKVAKVSNKIDKERNGFLYTMAEDLGWDFYTDWRDKRHRAKQTNANDKYNTAISKDPVNLKYKEAQKAQQEKDNKALFKASIQKYIIPVILIVALVVVILLLLKRPKKVKNPEPVVVQNKRQVTEARHTGALTVNYERLLQHNCSTLGLDYDKTLAQYNGDARAAVESTNLMMG